MLVRQECIVLDWFVSIWYPRARQTGLHGSMQLCLVLDDALETIVPCASRCLGDAGECPTIPPNPCNYVQLGSRQLGRRIRFLKCLKVLAP